MLLLHAMKSMDIITAVSVYVCSLFTTTNKVSDTHAKIQLLQPLLLMVISLLKLKESSGIAESDEKVESNNAEAVDDLHVSFENTESPNFSVRSKLDETELQSHMVTMELLLLTVNTTFHDPIAIDGSQEVIFIHAQLTSFASTFCSYLRKKIARSLTSVYKKAFLTYCQHILPQWLHLQSLPSSDHLDVMIRESQLLFTCCVFNERSLLEYSSIRPIFEAVRLDIIETNNAKKKSKASKRKLENIPSQNEDEYSLQKSFYELFFETLGTCFFSNSGNSGTTVLPLSNNAIAVVTNTFAVQSTAMELRGASNIYAKDKHVVTTTGGGHPTHNVESGSSAVDWRKNVVRQLHYILHVIDSLWLSMLSVENKDIPRTRGKNFNKKMKSKESNDDIGNKCIDTETSPEETGMLDFTTRDEDDIIFVEKLKSFIRFGQLRNYALTTLQKTLSNQSIPNHASLDKYTQRLKALASHNVSVVGSLYEKIERVVASDAPVPSEKKNTIVLELYTLLNVELESILILASIDHSLILENGSVREENLKKLITLSLSGRFYVPSADYPGAQWISWIDDAKGSKYSSISDAVAACTLKSPNSEVDIAESDSHIDSSITAYVSESVGKRSRCSQIEFHVILMKVWGEKLSLLRLILSIQTQLRAVDEAVAAFLLFEGSFVVTFDSTSATHEDIFASKFLSAELASAFSEVLVGQFDKLWRLLTNTVPATAVAATASEPTTVDSPALSFGIIRCTILQSLIRCSENQQRSEIGYLSQEQGLEDGRDTEIFSSLLHGHLHSIHLALRTSRTIKNGSIGGLIFSLLDSLSCLITYVTYRYSTSMKRLFVELSNPFVYSFFDQSGIENSNSSSSLKSLLLDATQHVLLGARAIIDDLVILDDQDVICYHAFLKAALSTLFCSINVSALGHSNPPGSIQSNWHCIALTKKSLHSVIESRSTHKEEAMLQILQLLLQNVIIWKDFASSLPGEEHLIEADIVPLFHNYFRYSISSYSEQQQQLRSMVFTALTSVDVIDCSFLVQCMNRALCEQWSSNRSSESQLLSSTLLATNILHRVPPYIIPYLSPLMPFLNTFVSSSVETMYNSSSSDSIYEGLESASTLLLLFLQKDKTSCVTREIDFISSIGISEQSSSIPTTSDGDIKTYFLFVERALAISSQNPYPVAAEKSKLRDLVLITLWARVRYSYSHLQHDHFRGILSETVRIFSHLLVSVSNKIALLHTISASIVDTNDSITTDFGRITEESYLVIMDVLLNQMNQIVQQNADMVDAQADSLDAYFLMIGDCIGVMQKISRNKGHTSSLIQNSEKYSKLIFDLLSILVGSTRCSTVSLHHEKPSALGWLLLVRKLPIEILLMCGVLTFSEGGPTGIVYVKESSLKVFLHTVKEKVILSITNQLESQPSAISCSTGCIIFVFLALVRLTLSASQCNVDLVDMYKMVNEIILCELFPRAIGHPTTCSSAESRKVVESFRTVVWSVYIGIVSELSQDPLKSGKISSESLSSFLREIIAANLRFCEMQISSSSGGQDVVDGVQGCYAVTVYLQTTTEKLSSLCKVSRSAVATKKVVEGDKGEDESLLNLQFHFWVGGLFGLVSLVTSKLPCMAAGDPKSRNNNGHRVMNTLSVKTIHSLLLILERIVQHSSHGSSSSSSSHSVAVLSTALGSVCVAMGRLLDCLIILDFAYSADSRSSSLPSPDKDILVHIHQCYQVSNHIVIIIIG